jgi:hypothetical protein
LPPFAGWHVLVVSALQVTSQVAPPHTGAPVDAPDTGPGHAVVHEPQCETSLCMSKQPSGRH